jgi:hypothetical protein
VNDDTNSHRLTGKVNSDSFLPDRIFLDTNVLQNMLNYGGYIFVEPEYAEQFPIADKKYSDWLFKNIDSLRKIFKVNDYANFQYVISKNSMDEVFDKKDKFGNQDKHFINWAYDVLDHTIACIEAYDSCEYFSGKGNEILTKIKDKNFGNYSEKDRKLLYDAVFFECDTFLTMDTNLWRNSDHVRKVFDLRLLQPYEFWDLLEPLLKYF